LLEMYQILPSFPRLDSKCGQKVQETSPWSCFVLFTLVAGGNQVKQGSHPWQVSLKRRQKHFCGGTVVSAHWVFTAALCTLYRDLLQYLHVTAGEHGLGLRGSSEQTLSVTSVIQHPKCDPRTPMNYDIALLKLDGTFSFSSLVLPACLPHPGENFEAGYICTPCGWGHLKKRKPLTLLFFSGMKSLIVLYEVNPPNPNSRKCSIALSTFRSPIQGDTTMCAGFPAGGRDACVLGSVSLCAKVSKLTVNWEGFFQKFPMGQSFCSVQDGKLCNSEGELHFPGSPNCSIKTTVSRENKVVPQRIFPIQVLCLWTLFGPEGNYIWLCSSREFCGGDLPLPLLIALTPDILPGKFKPSNVPAYTLGAVFHFFNLKLTYQSFEVEESEDCFYDAMTVYEDVGKEEEIVKSCGFALSAPVPSSAVMLVVFHSDEKETFGGFQATISFVHVAVLSVSEDACGMPSNQPRFCVLGTQQVLRFMGFKTAVISA
uniref:Ovochymase 2 n=1 Tax=Taeniopygia guttata TaxID=59729 RepID=H0Z468_TAEGU